jgi:ribosomal protein L11 methyltransferase
MSSENDANNLIATLCQQLKKRLADFGSDADQAREELEIKRRENLRNIVPDTLPQWQMRGEPILAGKNFVIARSWHRELVASDAKFFGRQLIQIDPGVSFNSAHNTTLACIDALEKYWRGGRMLDVGTGTGILAIAASRLYPSSEIDAFDISIDIVEQAKLHFELNETNHIDLRESKITEYEKNRYDLVFGNLLADIVIRLKQEIIDRVKPGGLAILSGFAIKSEGRTFANFDWNLTISEGKDAQEIATIFIDAGMEFVEQITKGEWVALVLRKPEGKE